MGVLLEYHNLLTDILIGGQVQGANGYLRGRRKREEGGGGGGKMMRVISVA